MPIIEGLLDPAGVVLRRRGAFSVLSKGADQLRIRCLGQDVSRAFVLATAWRGDGDIGLANAAIAVSPRPGVPEEMHFAVSDYYGLTFRIDNNPSADGPLADGDDEPGDPDTPADGSPAEPAACQPGGCLSCNGVETRGWYAWNNKMPPPPDDLHVIGEVHVPNPGVMVSLEYRTPQGINPNELLLDLHLRQLPGIWPQVFVWKQVRYDKVLINEENYSDVRVFCDEETVVAVPVENVV